VIVLARSLTTEKKVKSEEEKIKARELYVKKSNALVQKTRQQLSLMENKILLYVISKINEKNDEFQTYILSLKEFCEVCGIQSKGSYAEIKKIAKGMRDKSFWMESEDGGEVTVGWMAKAKVNAQKGTIELKLDDDLKPHLLGMKKKFTKYKYLYIMTMKSSYSMRIYELMKSYQNMGGIIFTVEELKEKLGVEPKKLARWVDFKRKAIEIALKEINELTDIKVIYTPIKRGREVYEIMFRVFKKNEVDLKVAHERIHRKLGVYADLAVHQQQVIELAEIQENGNSFDQIELDPFGNPFEDIGPNFGDKE
jgi:plasmid replication initiation protein